MNNKLEVKEFSLKQIVENLDRIPNNGKFGDNELKQLTPQEKKELLELVAKYNEYGKVLRCEQALMETVNTLDKIHKLAESYVLTEKTDEWFEGEIVKRDFNSLKKTNLEYKKLARECYGKLMQLNALYESNGQILNRYFEIKSLEEMALAPEAPHLSEDSELSPDKMDEKKWIQKAVDPKHKGYCTPMTKSTCTPARKALAMRFKKGDI